MTYDEALQDLINTCDYRASAWTEGSRLAWSQLAENLRGLR